MLRVEAHCALHATCRHVPCASQRERVPCRAEQGIRSLKGLAGIESAPCLLALTLASGHVLRNRHTRLYLCMDQVTGHCASYSVVSRSCGFVQGEALHCFQGVLCSIT